MKIWAEGALLQLKKSNKLFTELFRHGTLSIEVYKPVEHDLQKPHEQDEIYVVISGSGDFYCDGKVYPFVTGDLLFVKAGIEHRFQNFSDDFSTWVIFYGPKGGEQQ
jgi:mannose-6-phosphate isomerase-like protein (cupin superfamily)